MTASIWTTHTVEARKARWRALWALEELPRPLWFVPADPVLALSQDWLRRRRPVAALFGERDVQVREALKFNRSYVTLQRFVFRDDFVPRLQPQLGVGAFASAFGCRTQFRDEQWPIAWPLVGPGEPAERVLALEPPDVRAGLLGVALDYTDAYVAAAGDRYPLAMTDLQGPLDTASLVWNTTDFLAALAEHPREVHHVLRLATDLVKRFVREMRRRVREFVPAHFPPVFLPDGAGIAVSEDLIALIGRRHFEEFGLPYLNELSDEFGGLLLHSCGNIEHQLPALERIRNLRGLNFGVTETRFEAVQERLGGRVVLVPHATSASIVARFSNVYGWVDHVLRARRGNRGLALMVAPEVGDVHAAEHRMALGQKAPRELGQLVRFFSLGRWMRRRLAAD